MPAPTQNATLDVESTLTDRYQTTVPTVVRKTLRLGKRDKLHYKILADGNVLLSRAELEHSDPLIGDFLTFLENDMAAHPERLQSLSAERLKEATELCSGVEAYDPNEPLPEDD